MKTFLALSIFCFLFAVSGFSQTKTYFSSGGEMIFSFANIEDNGNSEGSIMRWAPVFNVQSMVNADLNEHIGLFTGFAFRNVGYIYGNYKPTTPVKAEEVPAYKKKFRSYNFGIPLGIKIGNLDKTFFYAGYEAEFPFLYKEKTFDGGDKIDKITGWFSPREEWFQHGFLVGVQFPYGFNIKFKYYLSGFHNQDFTEGNGTKPYANLNSHIFYFSLCTDLFKNGKLQSPVPIPDKKM
jgi:hypothetical protein